MIAETRSCIKAIPYFFRVYIGPSKHEGNWENSRQLYANARRSIYNTMLLNTRFPLHYTDFLTEDIAIFSSISRLAFAVGSIVVRVDRTFSVFRAQISSAGILSGLNKVQLLPLQINASS